MTTQKTKHRDRSEILGDMSAIENVVIGTLTEKRYKSAVGEETVYYQLQQWKEGRNETVYVPRDKVEFIKSGIEGHKRLEVLFHELAESDTAVALHTPAEDIVKKKRSKSSGMDLKKSPKQ